MAIKVQNNGGKGNPYHSESNGQFVSQDSSGGGENQLPEETNSNNNKSAFLNQYKLNSSSFNPNDVNWDDLFTDGNDDIDNFWNNLNNPTPTPKDVEKMTTDELKNEIQQHYNSLTKKGFVFKNYKNFFFNDLKLQCSNFRMIDNLSDRFPIKGGCSILFNTRIQSRSYVAQAVTMGASYNPFWGGSPTFTFNEMIQYNQLYYTNYDYHKNKMKDNILKGHFYDCSPENYASYATAHEYGHMVAQEILLKNGFEKETQNIDVFKEKDWWGRIEKSSSNKQAEIKKEVLNIYKQKFNLTDQDFRNELSGYGRDAGPEFLAEAFASLVCGKPSRVALAYEEYLKKHF